MGDYTAKRIGEMEAGFGGGFVKARAELGVTAFGLQVIQLPPNFGDYPEHDHAESGQEEVFLAHRRIGLDRHRRRARRARPRDVRAGRAGAKRKVYAGPEGLRMLAIGGAPGEAVQDRPDHRARRRRAEASRGPRASCSPSRRRAAAAISRAHACTSSSWTSSTGECM